MNCRIFDMHHKEVINIKDGMRLGCVSDVEIDTCTAKVVAIVVYGRLRCFGLLGREDDIVIHWDNVQIIGDDTILVNFNHFCHPRKRKRPFGGIFSRN